MPPYYYHYHTTTSSTPPPTPRSGALFPPLKYSRINDHKLEEGFEGAKGPFDEDDIELQVSHRSRSTLALRVLKYCSFLLMGLMMIGTTFYISHILYPPTPTTAVVEHSTVRPSGQDRAPTFHPTIRHTSITVPTYPPCDGPECLIHHLPGEGAQPVGTATTNAPRVTATSPPICVPPHCYSHSPPGHYHVSSTGKKPPCVPPHCYNLPAELDEAPEALESTTFFDLQDECDDEPELEEGQIRMEYEDHIQDQEDIFNCIPPNCPPGETPPICLPPHCNPHPPPGHHHDHDENENHFQDHRRVCVGAYEQGGRITNPPSSCHPPHCYPPTPVAGEEKPMCVPPHCYPHQSEVIQNDEERENEYMKMHDISPYHLRQEEDQGKKEDVDVEEIPICMPPACVPLHSPPIYIPQSIPEFEVEDVPDCRPPAGPCRFTSISLSNYPFRDVGAVRRVFSVIYP